MKANLQQINAFLKHHRLVLVGVSRDSQEIQLANDETPPRTGFRCDTGASRT